MPQKILRLGLTECSLLFIYWLNQFKNINNIGITNSKNDLIKWLYTTSGYYDKTQKGTYFDVIHNDNDPNVYNTYMKTIFDFIKNSDIFDLKLHDYSWLTRAAPVDTAHTTQYYNLKNVIQEFKDCINPVKENHLTQKIVFDFIKNKKILIISPFSPLIKSQIESGNCKKIYHTTPNVKNILTYKFPYTFFNNGPHNNLIETSEYIFNDINNNIKKEYDSVLISCGAYGCLMAQKFYNISKNVCVIGGDLQTYFGILNSRTKQWFQENNIEIKNKKCWIMSIPHKYKPEGYMKIENGCYW